MRNVSSAFMQALANDKRDYVNRAVIVLADETELELTNEEIWSNGVKIDDATSNDNVFEIGAAVINQATLIINNIYETYSEYDFTNAIVTLYTGLPDINGVTEEVKLGVYTVDDTAYNGSIITLTCLDNMRYFDKAYDSPLVYPATLDQIVRDACTQCGITLATNSLNFPRKTYIVNVRPSGESTTYRQVISWAAQIACCYARCNSDGELEIKFYDFTSLEAVMDGLDGGYFDSSSPYASGDTADGGSFDPWNTGYVFDAGLFANNRSVHQITSDYSCNIAVDPIVVTGVKVVLEVKEEYLSNYALAYSSSSTYAVGDLATNDGGLYKCTTAISTPEEFNPDKWESQSYKEYTCGTEGYVLSFEGNDFMQTAGAQTLTDALGTDLIGLTFRRAEITHPNDPTIEAGDVAVFWDRKSRSYPIIISSTTFCPSDSQRTTSSAASTLRNSAQRFTQAAKDYVDMRRELLAQRNDLNSKMAAAGGLYYTEVPQAGGGSIVYYHNKPTLAESNIQMVFSTTGFTVTDDGGQTWYGMTVDGQFIASILNTTGINADWINAGEFNVSVNNVQRFFVDTVTGTVRMSGGTVGADNGLYFGNTNYSSTVTIAGAALDVWRLIIGGKFGVTANGEVYASNVTLGDVTNTHMTADGDEIKFLNDETEIATFGTNGFYFKSEQPCSIKNPVTGTAYTGVKGTNYIAPFRDDTFITRDTSPVYSPSELWTASVAQPYSIQMVTERKVYLDTGRAPTQIMTYVSPQSGQSGPYHIKYTVYYYNNFYSGDPQESEKIWTSESDVASHSGAVTTTISAIADSDVYINRISVELAFLEPAKDVGYLVWSGICKISDPSAIIYCFPDSWGYYDSGMSSDGITPNMMYAIKHEYSNGDIAIPYYVDNFGIVNCYDIISTLTQTATITVIIGSNTSATKTIYKVGRFVNFSFDYTISSLSSSIAANTSYTMGQLPSGWAPICNQYIHVLNSANRMMQLQIGSDGNITLYNYGSAVTSGGFWVRVSSTYITNA